MKNKTIKKYLYKLAILVIIFIFCGCVVFFLDYVRQIKNNVSLLQITFIIFGELVVLFYSAKLFMYLVFKEEDLDEE